MRSATHLHDTGRRVTTRTCVGCGQRSRASELIRLVIVDEVGTPQRETTAQGDPGVAFDLRGGAWGRGAHVHARPACLSRAPRGIARSFRRNVGIDVPELGRRLVRACDRRMVGLLLSARRLACVSVGTAASLEAIRHGAPLAIVAVDAGAIASSSEVADAVGGGRAIAWKEKNELGGLLGEPSVAICAVRDERIAAELKTMCAAASAGAAAMREGGECSKSPEVR
ncbi:MAG TPA: YlxR family protein [Polyangiaceae bacterium]|nr:YlxR family protein [Polyangiaceae bacterium]